RPRRGRARGRGPRSRRQPRRAPRAGWGGGGGGIAGRGLSWAARRAERPPKLLGSGGRAFHGFDVDRDAHLVADDLRAFHNCSGSFHGAQDSMANSPMTAMTMPSAILTAAAAARPTMAPQP